MKDNCLSGWSDSDYQSLEKGVLLASHTLGDTGLFDDEELLKIIDNHPDDHLTIGTMGTDTNTFQWRECERNSVSAEVLLELVKQGRLWINARNVLDYQPAIGEVVNEMYNEMEAKSSGFRAQNRSANLLISSPSALVHYHIDMPVNMLWHIRGRKRVWVYPPFDFRFCSQLVVEKVCSGEFSEDIPYNPGFDKYAMVFDVDPGQLLTWPQLTPHRVTNLEGLNVSLSTEHKNARARRRINVHEANCFLRNRFPRFRPTANVDGWSGHLKQALSRGLRMHGRIIGKTKQQFVYTKTMKVDPESPNGVAAVAGNAPDFMAPHEATPTVNVG